MAQCELCREPFTPNFAEQRFCSRRCGSRWRVEAGIPNTKLPSLSQRLCENCGTLFLVRPRKRKRFCSSSCKMKYLMALPEFRAKALTPQFLVQTPFVPGHTPWNKGAKLPSDTFKARGGNGRPLTVPQQSLLTALGPTWKAEHTISLGGGKHPGYPTAYKVDLALVDERLAIEVDGPSHGSPIARERDNKKDSKLRELGWIVWRVTNENAIKLSELPSHQIIDAIQSVYHS